MSFFVSLRLLSYQILGAFLSIVQIVYSINGVLNDLSNAQIISFDFPPTTPKYPEGGGFGVGTINLGGLEVYQAQTFIKIWSTSKGGPNYRGLSFYEPIFIPSGHRLLGHFGRPNAVPLYASVLTAKDTTGGQLNGTLKNPINYTLIWTSEKSNLDQTVDAYIWLPVPPMGYKAIGHIVTTSPLMPSLDKVSCVRSDFTDSLEVDTWIWGLKGVNGYDFNIYSTRPISRGTQSLSVPAGTFMARIGDEHTHDISCLKRATNDIYYAMPNSLQISAMIGAFAPWIYLHPNEEYFPSSVLWFFENGALLYEKGNKGPPSLVVNDGDNLPKNGSQDDAYLDLPIDQNDRNRVKKGSFQDFMGYIHVKPALGATFTDLAIWVYYPFNGGGRFQLGPFDIDLGRIGQHVSDWEHVTLRIDNFRGKLKAIYLSRHSSGAWLNAQEFEYFNGSRPVIYASLHGHAHYSTESYHLHTEFDIDPNDLERVLELCKDYKKEMGERGEKIIGFGARDDTAKSDKVMDVASSYQVISVDYKALDVEPWVNYTGLWGPKITYGYKNDIVKIANRLPRRIKDFAIRILNKLPPELVGEEGPDGPKVEGSWYGDEKV